MDEQLEVQGDGRVRWQPPKTWTITRDVPPFGSHQLRYGSEGGRLCATFNPLVAVVVTDVVATHLNALGVTPDGWS